MKSTLHPNSSQSDFAVGCRHYRGDRPCLHNRLCRGCNHYDPYKERICIIKLGALGDVIRTLCILPRLRALYPQAQITWISKPNGCRMIEDHPLLDRTLAFDPASHLILAAESFDLLLSLDKDPEPCALANLIRAPRKLGIGLSQWGVPVPLNPEAERYFALGLCDDLKFKQNRQSYPELIYEALGWKYAGERYVLPLDSAVRREVWSRLAQTGWCEDELTIGVNVGAGSTFANKMWPVHRIVDVIIGLQDEIADVQILLLGGVRERHMMDQVTASLAAHGRVSGVFDAGADHSEKQFVAVVEACDVIFGGDTMAMHVAIARGKPTVVFFGPTCAQEIDLFGKGEKLITNAPCSPCYKRVCDQQNVCVGDLPTQETVKAIATAAASISKGLGAGVLMPLRQAG